MNWKETLKKESFSNETQMRIAENREREVREMRNRDKQHNSGQPITPDGEPAKPPLAPISQRLKEAFGEQELSSQQKNQEQ